MTFKTGRNRNTNDESTISSAIALNDTTSVKIADANPNRTFLQVSVKEASIPAFTRIVYLKLQPAATDNDKKGIIRNSGDEWEMVVDSMYTGEISAILEDGTEDVFVTEY